MGDHGDEWEFQRIGTESEKSSVEKELAELRERLSKVEEWKKRRQEIEEELNRVWVEGKYGEGQEELPPPSYLESEGVHEQAGESGGSEHLSSSS
jgi:ATP-binding cassette subfamily D (ALD) long-chain fatty acid import protein